MVVDLVEEMHYVVEMAVSGEVVVAELEGIMV